MLFSEYKNNLIKEELNISQIEFIEILESKNIVLHNLNNINTLDIKTILYLLSNVFIIILCCFYFFQTNNITNLFSYILAFLLLLLSFDNISKEIKKIVIPIYIYIVKKMKVDLKILESIKSSTKIEKKYLLKIDEFKNINYKDLYKIFEL